MDIEGKKKKQQLLHIKHEKRAELIRFGKNRNYLLNKKNK